MWLEKQSEQFKKHCVPGTADHRQLSITRAIADQSDDIPPPTTTKQMMARATVLSFDLLFASRRSRFAGLTILRPRVRFPAASLRDETELSPSDVPPPPPPLAAEDSEVARWEARMRGLPALSRADCAKLAFFARMSLNVGYTPTPAHYHNAAVRSRSHSQQSAP